MSFHVSKRIAWQPAGRAGCPDDCKPPVSHALIIHISARTSSIFPIQTQSILQMMFYDSFKIYLITLIASPPKNVLELFKRNIAFPA